MSGFFGSSSSRRYPNRYQGRNHYRKKGLFGMFGSMSSSDAGYVTYPQQYPAQGYPQYPQGYQQYPQGQRPQYPQGYTQQQTPQQYAQPQVPATPQHRSLPGGAGAGSAAGLTCAQCGTVVPAGSKFCLGCGAKMTANATFCGSCGKPLSPGAKFCMECGAPSQQ